MIRVVAIDDHDLILVAVSDVLSKQSDMELVGTAYHGSKLFELVDKESPDVVVLDIRIEEGFEPISAVRELLERHPNVEVLILTGDDNLTYRRKLTQAGAKGYVLKGDDLSSSLPKAVRKLHAGERYYSSTVVETLLSDDAGQELNSREMDVLRLAAQGLQSDTIGEELHITEGRVRNIISGIYQKLGIQEKGKGVIQRVVLANKAREKGLLLDK